MILVSPEEIEKKALIRLQCLSDKISDLIQNNDYENVLRLDEERKKIISSFKNKPSKNTLTFLSQLNKSNKKEISVLEEKQNDLRKNFNKAIKIFSSYIK